MYLGRLQLATSDDEVVLPCRLVEQEKRAGVDHPQEVRARDLPQGRWPVDQHEEGRRGTKEETGRIILEGLCLDLLLRLCDGEVGLQMVEGYGVGPRRFGLAQHAQVVLGRCGKAPFGDRAILEGDEPVILVYFGASREPNDAIGR